MKKKKCTDYDQCPEVKPEQKRTQCPGLSFFIQVDTVGHSLLNFPPLASMATCSSWFSPLSQSPFKGQTCILSFSPWWLLLSLLSSHFLQFYSNISAAPSQACVPVLLTVLLGWPKTCSSSFSHTTTHQSAQDKFCSHSELSPRPPVLTEKELRPVNSASFFRLCFLLPSAIVTIQAWATYHLFPGWLQSFYWVFCFWSCIFSVHSPCWILF